MSMTMPFPVAEGVSLEGIAPGDAVEFTFEVTWQPRAGYRVTEIHELPAGTEIDFGSPPPGE
jgi:Cu/Ag efflux protein CusF